MKNESVAILDIRSNEVSFSLGSRGVNGTFAFSNTCTMEYDGCFSSGLLDEASFRSAVASVITSVKQRYDGTVEGVYVSVPSAFTTVKTMGHTISFSSKRKISEEDVEALFESGFNGLLATERCVRRSAMYYTLGDNRKYFSTEDLYGVSTNVLKGALCYYFIDEKFYKIVGETLSEAGFTSVKYIPSTLAQAEYLLTKKRREGYAFLLDFGFLASSMSVLYGDGIVHEETFDCGVATILVDLIKAFDIDYVAAEEILLSANISGGAVPADMRWTLESADKSFSVSEINDVIKCGLDNLCEKIENFFMLRYKDKTATPLAANPICVTGEGLVYLKGVAEHISRRLNRLTEIVSPDLPYYDKPTFSSRISLLNTATSEQKKKKWYQKIFKNGGRKR